MMIQTHLSLLLLICILCACACAEPLEVVEEIPEEPPIETSDSLSYLALGDSYTIGQGVDPSLRWPNQLAEKLLENDVPIDSVRIIARTGWTTRNLIDAVEASDAQAYDLVSLLIGVNNQYRQQDFILFETEFDQLLNRATQLAGTKEKVFVVSIPDYGVTPFGAGNREQIAAELDQYNAYMAEKCSTLEIPFIDITEISRDLGDAPEALAPDELHPSGTQYAAWVEEILPVVLEMLGE